MGWVNTRITVRVPSPCAGSPSWCSHGISRLSGALQRDRPPGRSLRYARHGRLPGGVSMEHRIDRINQSLSAGWPSSVSRIPGTWSSSPWLSSTPAHAGDAAAECRSLRTRRLRYFSAVLLTGSSSSFRSAAAEWSAARGSASAKASAAAVARPKSVRSWVGHVRRASVSATVLARL